MKKLFFVLFASLTSSAFAMPLDSIGVKSVGGKQYIMHKVTKGEGVYGISKKYGVTAGDVFAANAGSDKGIKIDQVLLIPRNGASSVSSSSSGASASIKQTEKKYHVVTSGQTLSSIAKKYDLSIDELKKLNGLKSDNIQLGQKLVVGETTTYSAQTKPVKPVEKVTPKTEKAEETPEIAEEQKVEKVVVKKEKPADNNVVVEADKNNNQPAIVTKTYTVDDGDEISESGIAMISSEGELSQDRSFILHPTAKIGTIIMITNPANNNAVFARVVGTCKAGNGTILKMSKTVADKLGLKEDSNVKINYAR